MKSLFLFASLLAAFTASAAEPAPAAADPAAPIRALDLKRQQAAVARDVPALREIFSADCQYIHSSGKSQTGADYLAMLERGEIRYRSFDYEFPPSVTFAGENTAFVSGRVALVSLDREGRTNERVLASTAVYGRTDQKWRLLSYQSTPAAAAPVPTILSEHVAARDVCAWPKLTLLADGTIIAILYDQPAHGIKPGDVACWASTDGGKTWAFRGNATRHEGNSAWFNHALGQAANGDLLVATSGWDYGQDGRKTNVPYHPIVTRSKDGGRTWQQVAQVPPPPDAGKALIPFGNIERGADDSLRFAAYAFARGIPGPRQDPGYVVVSRDDGASWKAETRIGFPEVNETDLLHAGDKRWLAAARNLTQASGKAAHSIDMYVSDDDGATWRRHARVTDADAHPGDLLKLADGRILLTYGDRRAPSFGVNARLSSDGGLTWSPEFRIVRELASRDSGYPSSVQLVDGTIVTAYYANGAKGKAGYILGVVRWQVPATR